MNARLGILFLAIFTFLSSAHAASYRYDWTDGSSGFSGSIVLDSDSSNAGTLANIISAEVTLDNTYVLYPMGALLAQPLFAWNSSEITDMNIIWFTWSGAVTTAANVSMQNLNVLGSSNSGYDRSGSWSAVRSSVPEMGSTALLLAFGLVSVAAIRKRIS